MPMKLWRKDAKLIGASLLALLAASALLFIGFGIGVSSGRYGTEAELYASTREARLRDDLKKCDTAAGTAQTTCIAEAIKASRSDERAELDLDAQRRSSDWSLWLLFISIGQLLVGAGGFIALFRTLRQGQEANEIARDVGEAQTRCYLSPSDVTLRIDGHGDPSVELSVFNSGQSPAVDFHWLFTARVRLTGSWDWTSGQMILDQFRPGTYIPAQASPKLSLTFLNGAPLPQADLSDLLLQPTVRLSVEITAQWKDVFKKKFRQTWRFQAEHQGPSFDADMPLWSDIPSMIEHITGDGPDAYGYDLALDGHSAA